MYARTLIYIYNYYIYFFLRLINLLLEKEEKTKSDEWRVTLSLFEEEGYCSSASCRWGWKFVATQPELRRDVEVATSGRSDWYVGTQLRLRRDVFLSISPCCWTRHETPVDLRQIKPVNSEENGNHDDAYCHFNHTGGYLFQNKQAYNQDY